MQQQKKKILRYIIWIDRKMFYSHSKFLCHWTVKYQAFNLLKWPTWTFHSFKLMTDVAPPCVNTWECTAYLHHAMSHVPAHLKLNQFCISFNCFLFASSLLQAVKGGVVKNHEPIHHRPPIVWAHRAGQAGLIQPAVTSLLHICTILNSLMTPANENLG